MSEQPMVACVMLTRDRPEMAKRAVECFRRQTYPAGYCWLFILDTGEEQLPITGEKDTNIFTCGASAHRSDSIGALRNLAAAEVISGKCAAELGVPDILVHFDDDDYSHPNRLAEQVTLLQASGADCVGYSDMLFWDTRIQVTESLIAAMHSGTPTLVRGAAWLYLGPQKALGTSLMYWRRTWERKPFPDQPRPGHANGEDTDWIKGLNLVTATSLHHASALELPRMIASIHGANTSGSYKLIGNSTSWMRVPEFDKYCRERMAL